MDKKPRTAAQLAADEKRREIAEMKKAQEERKKEAEAKAAEEEQQQPEFAPAVDDFEDVDEPVKKPEELKAEVEARLAEMPVTKIDNIEEVLKEEEAKIAPPKPEKKKPASILDKNPDEMSDEEALQAAAVLTARNTLKESIAKARQQSIDAELAKGEKNMELLISQQPVVKVHYPWYPGALETRNVQVNGIKKVVYIGEWNELPLPHAEVLLDALEVEHKNHIRFKKAEKRYKNYENVLKV